MDREVENRVEIQNREMLRRTLKLLSRMKGSSEGTNF